LKVYAKAYCASSKNIPQYIVVSSNYYKEMKSSAWICTWRGFSRRESKRDGSRNGLYGLPGTIPFV
jgi:hypothetical protein